MDVGENTIKVYELLKKQGILDDLKTVDEWFVRRDYVNDRIIDVLDEQGWNISKFFRIDDVGIGDMADCINYLLQKKDDINMGVCENYNPTNSKFCNKTDYDDNCGGCIWTCVDENLFKCKYDIN